MTRLILDEFLNTHTYETHHTYEIVLRNKGEIDAIFSFNPSKTAFGSRFSFTPTEGIVMPGGYQLIEVSFSAMVTRYNYVD